MESNAISKRLYTHLNHGQEVVKFIKLIEFAILMSFQIMVLSSKLVTFQCGGINASLQLKKHSNVLNGALFLTALRMMMTKLLT